MLDVIFCEYCGRIVFGDYIDRGMFFCNPTCAIKQAEEQFKKDDEKKVDYLLSLITTFECKSCGWIGLKEEMYKSLCPKCGYKML
jgi:hypothetical protein